MTACGDRLTAGLVNISDFYRPGSASSITWWCKFLPPSIGIDRRGSDPAVLIDHAAVLVAAPAPGAERLISSESRCRLFRLENHRSPATFPKFAKAGRLAAEHQLRNGGAWVERPTLARRANIRVNAAGSRMIENRLRHPTVVVERGFNHRPAIVRATKDPGSVGGAVSGRALVARTVRVLRVGRSSQRRGQ